MQDMPRLLYGLYRAVCISKHDFDGWLLTVSRSIPAAAFPSVIRSMRLTLNRHPNSTSQWFTERLFFFFPSFLPHFPLSFFYVFSIVTQSLSIQWFMANGIFPDSRSTRNHGLAIRATPLKYETHHDNVGNKRQKFRHFPPFKHDPFSAHALWMEGVSHFP